MTISKNNKPTDLLSAALATNGFERVAELTLHDRPPNQTAAPTSNATTTPQADAVEIPTKTLSFSIPMGSGYQAPPVSPKQKNSDGSPVTFPNRVFKILQRAFTKTPGGAYAVSDKMMLEAKRELASFWGLPEGMLQADGKNLELSENGKTGSAVDPQGSFVFTLNGHSVGLNVYSEPKLSTEDIETLKTPQQKPAMVTTILGDGVRITAPANIVVTPMT